MGKIRGHPERDLQKTIWEYLTWNKVFAWIDDQPMIKPGTGRFRCWHPSSSGVSDILGIFRGIPLAIEVKVGRNILAQNQVEFQEKFRRAGGIAFRANSIESVKEQLNAWATEKGLDGL